MNVYVIEVIVDDDVFYLNKDHPDYFVDDIDDAMEFYSRARVNEIVKDVHKQMNEDFASHPYLGEHDVEINIKSKPMTF